MKDELKKELLNEEELEEVSGGIIYRCGEEEINGCDPDGKHQPHPHPKRIEETDEVVPPLPAKKRT